MTDPLPPCFICGMTHFACGHRETELLVHLGYRAVPNNNDWWTNQRRNGDKPWKITQQPRYGSQ